MTKLSEELKTKCCGSTGEREALIKIAQELEQENYNLKCSAQSVVDLQIEIDSLESDRTKFAEECFRSGYVSGMNFESDALTAWLKFCSMKGIDP